MGLKVTSGGAYTVTTVLINAAKNDTRVLVATPGAGYALYVLGMSFGSDADGTATFRDDTPTNHSGAVPLLVDGSNNVVWPTAAHPDYAWIKCAEDTALEVILSVDSDLDGVLIYATVAV